VKLSSNLERRLSLFPGVSEIGVMHINAYELIFRVAHVGPAQSCRGIIVGRGLTS
jgi:hypothetical protein